MGKRTVTALAIPGMIAILLTGGCTSDGICGSTQYPVTQVRGGGGGDCVDKGKEPPAGYTRYPEGKVPQQVDDKWDKYWMEHSLDEKGREIPG
jgi:hypothetical protein